MAAPGSSNAQVSAVSAFTGAAKERPDKGRVGFGILVEYLMFASGVFLALMLFATRVPLRFIDTTFGLRLRERFVDFLARVSPG